MTIDQYLFTLINTGRNPLFDVIFIIASVIGPFVAVASAVLFMPRKGRRMLWLYIIALGSDFLLTYFLKYAIMRPRPEGMMLLPKEMMPSFPSLHSSIAFTWLGFMGGFGKKIYAASSVFAVLVGISRIYLGDHYPSDVIFGAVMGYAISALTIRLGNVRVHRQRKR